MKYLITLSLIAYIAPLSTLSVPAALYAQTQSDPIATYTLLEPLPCLNDGTQKCADGLVKEVNFADYVRYAFNLIIALSAVAAVFMIVVGGFKYVTTDSFQGKGEGKKILGQALQGLLLVLCSYLILRTIDPRLVDIPATLVKPLPITYQKGITMGYFNSLADEATRKDAEAKAAVAKAKEAANLLELQNEKIRDFEAVLASATSSAQAKATAQSQIEQIKQSESYKTTTYTKEVSNATGIIINQSKSTLDRIKELSSRGTSTFNDTAYENGNLIDAEVESTIRSIDAATESRNTALKSMGAPANVISQVTDRSMYEKSILLLRKTQSRIERAQLGGSDGVSFSYSPVSDSLYVSKDEAMTELLKDTDRVNIYISKMSRDSSLRADLIRQTTAVLKNAQTKIGAQ